MSSEKGYASKNLMSKEYASKEFLSTEPIPRLLFRLAVPTVIAQLVNMLYNIIDRIYIGHMPQDSALALTGIGVCMPLILCISAFACLVSSGGAPRASIRMGQKDREGAEQILGNCLTLLLLLSASLTLVLLLFGRSFLLLFGASKQTIGFASSYMGIYALGTVFVQLTLGLNMFITAQGFTRTAMLTVLLGALTNILLDPVFIFVLNMGVRGAALATILSQMLSCLWCLAFLCGGKTLLRIRRKYLPLRADIILPCIALGLATFIIQVTESIIQMCFNSSLLRYGGDIAVGAMTICSSVFQFALLPVSGVGQGAQPIASYNFGARNAARVKETFRILVTISLAYTLALCLLILCFPRSFAGIFTRDPALLAYAATALRIYCVGISLFGIQMACQLLFTSIGYALCSILVAVVRKIVLLIPLIYLLPRIGILETRALDVYLAEPVADILAVCFTSVLFAFQFRRALRSLE